MESATYPWQQRTALLLGEDKMQRLRHAHVLAVGVGGVGAYAVELLCRAGVGKLTLVDGDTVQPTNINRQLPALHSTVGQYKVTVLESRLRDINPQVELTLLPLFLQEEQIPPLLDSTRYDFIVDAIDTLGPKCRLIAEALQRGLPIVSSMGAGAKVDIAGVRLADVWHTDHCALSKAVRSRLRKMGVKQSLPVVFSTEEARPEAILPTAGEPGKRSVCGTVSYLPAAFGCYLAQYVIQKL
ncbi:MAG: tRNA threonylcarbamoyladenosine dehydratase [Prevotellaceae bacterium]|nr:tRNA threonylcarbamoyladenosine dehydratase [Prevotellaceae bacterium]